MPVKIYSLDPETNKERGGYGRSPEVSEVATYLIPKFKADTMIQLMNHFITARNPEYIPASYVEEGRWARGQLQPVRIYRSAETLVGESFTLTLPAYKRTPIDYVSHYGRDCYYLLEIRQCGMLDNASDDDCLQCDDEYHLYDVIISIPQDVQQRSAARAGGADTNRRTATVQVTGKTTIMNMSEETLDTDATNPLYFVRYLDNLNNCNCGGTNCGHTQAIMVGGGGTNGYVGISYDGFVSTTEITAGVPAGSIATDGIILQDGTIIVTYADDPDPGIATTGGIRIDIGGSGTFTDGLVSVAETAIDKPMYGIVRNGSQVFIYGDAARELHKWVTNTDEFDNLSSQVPAGAYRDGQRVGNKAHLVGGIAGEYQYYTINEKLQVVDLAANLPTPSGTDRLEAICVYDSGIVIIGSREGYMHISVDEGETWEVLRSFAGTPVVYGIDGNQHHIYFSVGDQLYTMNPFTGLNVRIITPLSTLTGNITDVAVEQQRLENNGVLVTITSYAVVTAGGDKLLFSTCDPDLMDVINS